MSGLQPSYENIIKQDLEIADLKRAYHALMGQAVTFAEDLVVHAKMPLDGDEARAFLASPEVQAWREQEEL